jgi:hypothetical protein
VAVNPLVNYSRVALDFHQPACLAAVVVAVFTTWLATARSLRRIVVAGAAISLIAGVSLASDTLFVTTGLAPFAATGLLFAYLRRWREAFAVGACLVGAWAVSTSAATSLTSAQVVVTPRASLQLVAPSQLWSNLTRGIGLVAQVTNGNFSQAGWSAPTTSFSSGLAVACAVIGILSLAGAPAILLVRARSTLVRSPRLAVWTLFWTVAALATLAGYTLTRVGESGDNGGYYLLVAVYAIAATLPILLAATSRLRLIGGIVVGVLLTGSLWNVAGTPNTFGGLPTLASVAPRIAAIAKAEHAPYGFTTDYFDASALSWSTNLAVQMQSLQFCEPSVLCPFAFNAVSSWFAVHPSRSFVLQDAAADWIDTRSSSQFGAPSASFKLDREFTLYIYPYDIASRLNDSNAPWSPSLGYGSGFNAPEQFQGLTSRWMIQNGQVEIVAPVPARVVLTTAAFANQIPRVVELRDGHGRILARRTVATSLTPLSFGPILLPAGATTLTFVSSPGAEPLGNGDTRRASVFFEPLQLEGGPSLDPPSGSPAG